MFKDAPEYTPTEELTSEDLSNTLPPDEPTAATLDTNVGNGPPKLPDTPDSAVDTPDSPEPVAVVEATDTPDDTLAELGEAFANFDAKAAQTELDTLLNGGTLADLEAQAIANPADPNVKRAQELTEQLATYEQQKQRQAELLQKTLADAGVPGTPIKMNSPDANGNPVYKDQQTGETYGQNMVDMIILMSAFVFTISNGSLNLNKLTNAAVKNLFGKMGASPDLLKAFDRVGNTALYQEMLNSMSEDALVKKIDDWTSEELFAFLSNIEEDDRKSLLSGKDVGPWSNKKRLSAENLAKLHAKLDDKQRKELEFTIAEAPAV